MISIYKHLFTSACHVIEPLFLLGTKGSPNPVEDKSLFNVEFDDGDTGKIPIDHIRIIPQDFPHVGKY